ncbi:MAG TPA: hypothetical protein VK530_05710 [Candidatus Acidoferrum sp.]|nr:hypothetical protein [Candidatus Acidoferrum sp.]
MPVPFTRGLRGEPPTLVDSAPRSVPRRAFAFTLMEIVASLVILGIMITGIVITYIQAHRTAEWSTYSLAAHSLAMQSVEQVRAAMWDTYRYPAVDMTTNVAMRVTNVLDVPISKTNLVYATNRVVVTSMGTTPPLKKIYVETTWKFMNRGVFTNSILTYRAPDQ